MNHQNTSSSVKYEKGRKKRKEKNSIEEIKNMLCGAAVL
jgi:hypothetical protein